jgi:3,4-dihydroxy 2-butanone 4-phosphate synthase/GTP cyclohydrolase II
MMSAQPETSALRDDPIGPALAALMAGKPVLVRDDRHRENEGDVVLPAALATPRWTAWAVRHTSGLLCAPLPAERADLLELRPMTSRNEDPHGTAYAVSVDAARGVTTGISATDRATTARVLANPDARPADLNRPGHVIPLRARAGGVLERAGHTEASVDLCRLAGLPPVALIAELVSDSGDMASARAIADLAARTGLVTLDIADLVAYRLIHGDGERARVTRGARRWLPSEHGELEAVGYRDEVTGAEHIALLGRHHSMRPLVSVHVECTLGDVFGASTCRCARRLADAAELIARDGGVLVYLRHPSAPVLDPHDWSAADDGAAAAILTDLGQTAIRLLPGPVRSTALARAGLSAIEVAGRSPLLPADHRPVLREIS